MQYEKGWPAVAAPTPPLVRHRLETRGPGGALLRSLAILLWRRDGGGGRRDCNGSLACGEPSRSKASTMTMQPPQQGHGGRWSAAMALFGWPRRQPVERAHHRPEGVGGNASVNGGRVELGVAERKGHSQRIADLQIDALLARPALRAWRARYLDIARMPVQTVGPAVADPLPVRAAGGGAIAARFSRLSRRCTRTGHL